MDVSKKSCCARAAGWSLVGIAIAVAWGMGNVANGMAPMSAFAIPGLIVLAIVGIVALSALNVPWFNRICSCPAPQHEKDPDANAESRAKTVET